MKRISIIYILLGNSQCTPQPPLQHQAAYLHSLFRYHWYCHNGTNSVVALAWNRKRGRSVPWYQCYRRNRRAVSERCVYSHQKVMMRLVDNISSNQQQTLFPQEDQNGMPRKHLNLLPSRPAARDDLL
jgi:hypothetical protein